MSGNDWYDVVSEADEVAIGLCRCGRGYNGHSPVVGRCAACGAPLTECDDRAETINRSTGARGVCHAECYLADQCCYELA